MFAENLKNLIYDEKLTVPEFSKIVNIKYKTVNSWLNHGKEPQKYITLIQIKQKYREAKNQNINLDWLISGEGEMFISADNQNIMTSPDLEKTIENKFNELMSEYGLLNGEKSHLPTMGKLHTKPDKS